MTSIFRRGLLVLLTALVPAAALVLLSVDAFAGRFTVNPTRVFIEGSKKTAAINVTNDDDREMGFQLSAVSWTQDDEGRNVFAETKEIIFFPKITTIKSGETKTIRIGYQGGAGAKEKTFRIFMQELAPPKGEGTSVGFTIKVSVPIFIVPVKAAAGGSIESVDLSGGSLLVTFKNSGNVHVVVSKAAATALDSDGKELFTNDTAGWYVLAGHSSTYSIDMPREQCLKTRAVKVVVRTEEAMLERTVDLDPSRCGRE